MKVPQPPPLQRHISLLTGAAIVGALYFGRQFFLPLVLAVLISFLLAPLIRRLERLHLGRIGSVIVATALTFGIIGSAGYVVTGQLIDLANQLPQYKDNLRAKVAAVKMRKDGPIEKATQTLREITAEATEDQPGESGPATTAGSSAEGEKSANSAVAGPPVPVQVVKRADNAFELLRGYISPFLAPLGNTAVVIVFVIFILIGREDLRDRIIHLIGRSRLRVTTQALDDAGRRVSRYLLAQFIVNVTYGIPIGIGLYFIGIPNAVLWGLLATVLRFVPYVGPWIAAIFPLLLSVAVSPTWTAPMLTLSLFVAMELLSNNVVEPWLYGSSTGLSAMAIIVSAAFWTWLWGAVGLILATPLTVCLAVLGKYTASLGWLDVLLADKPPIAAGDRLYQRLLAGDEEEAVDIVEAHIAAQSLASAYDDVVLPAIREIEADAAAGTLQDEDRRGIYQILRRLLAELDETPPLPPSEAAPVLCLPASSEADELVAIMLAHLLEKRGAMASVGSCRSLTSEMVEQAVASAATIFCISAVPPASVMPATYLAKRLRQRQHDAKVLVGVWNAGVADDRRIERLKRVQTDDVFSSLDKASGEIALLVGLKAEPLEAAPAPGPAEAPVVAVVQPA